MPPRDRTYLLSAAVCGALVALPWLAVAIPPITDLPQQAAQIRLLGEALADPDGPYRVQWSDPNKLGYLPLAAGWAVGGPLAAGRLGMLLIGLAWVAAVHALARAAGRPPAAAAVASLFFFNHVTYWGFPTFLIGLPVFVGWLLLLDRLPPDRTRWREGLGLLAAAALLYSAHVLWLAAGAAALVATGAGERWPARCWLLRLAWLAPVAAAVAWWYPDLAAAGFDSRTTWGQSVLERLDPRWLLSSAFGGLRGPTEGWIALAVLAWLAAGVAQSRRPDAPDRVDRRLLLLGLTFLGAALALPAVYQHTIFFASRWVPVAAVLLSLALPPPPLRPLVRTAFPLLLLASLSVATTAAWLGFERDELAGLHEALSELPAGQRVLGLDFVRTSPRIQGFPYYHLYAYAQVVRGGELSRSFAEEASSLVVYRQLPHAVPWTPGLDWRATDLRHGDVAHFDAVVVHGPPPVQEVFLADPRLRPVTGRDRQLPWRLYAVR